MDYRSKLPQAKKRQDYSMQRPKPWRLNCSPQVPQVPQTHSNKSRHTCARGTHLHIPRWRYVLLYVRPWSCSAWSRSTTCHRDRFLILRRNDIRRRSTRRRLKSPASQSNARLVVLLCMFHQRRTAHRPKSATRRDSMRPRLRSTSIGTSRSHPWVLGRGLSLRDPLLPQSSQSEWIGLGAR